MSGVSNYPGGFANGITIRGLPINLTHPGKVFWVNNSTVVAEGGVGGSNSNAGTYQKPFSTLAYAISKCTSGRGDIIMLMPGHSEDITAAAAITVNKNGIAIVGIGTGALQPQIHATTSAAADIDVTATDVTFYNVRFTAGVANITPGILDVSGDGFTMIKCLFDEDGSNENYQVAVDFADGTDNVWVESCEYRGGDADNDNWLKFAGTHANLTFLGNRLYQGVAQTAAAALILTTTAATNVLMRDNYIYTATAAIAAAGVVLTGTSNTGWAVNNYVKSIDTDATAANFTSGFDVTGLGSFENYAVADTDAKAVNWATADDVT